MVGGPTSLGGKLKPALSNWECGPLKQGLLPVCYGSTVEVARFEHFMAGAVSNRLSSLLSAEELAKATSASKSSKLITAAADYVISCLPIPACFTMFPFLLHHACFPLACNINVHFGALVLVAKRSIARKM